MTTNIDLSNRALAMAGTRSQITDFTSTAEGLYCGLLYNQFRDFLLRMEDYDFSIGLSAPVLVTGVAVYPWGFAYRAPGDCVRVRQLVPANITPFDPQPISWSVTGFQENEPTQGPLILTTMEVGGIVYTSNGIQEDGWDTVFTDAFVRMLSSGLAFALENRIEAHNLLIKEALEFAQTDAAINS